MRGMTRDRAHLADTILRFCVVCCMVYAEGIAGVHASDGLHGPGSGEPDSAVVTAWPGGPGWDCLAAGQDWRALQIFAASVRDERGDGLEKVGYALALASQENWAGGVWAMRRAWAQDPESIHGILPRDQRLAPLLRRLVETSTQLAARPDQKRQAAFMLAALHYLMSDRHASLLAVEAAIHDGDRTVSAANLRRAIDRLPEAPGQTVRSFTAARPGPLTTTSLGWTKFARGDFPDAQRTFASEAVLNPQRGDPKIGYALSTAALGDLAIATWAMRRALRIEPEALAAVARDERIRPAVESLVKRYAARLGRTDRVGDNSCMLAALHYVLGDAPSARGAIGFALARGARTRAELNLERLVEALPVVVADARDDGPESDPGGPAAPDALGDDLVAATSLAKDEAPDSRVARVLLASPGSASPSSPSVRPAAPREPVEYAVIGEDLRAVSEALGRLNGALLSRLERAMSGIEPARTGGGRNGAVASGDAGGSGSSN